MRKKYLGAVGAIIFSLVGIFSNFQNANAAVRDATTPGGLAETDGCAKVKVIFARGSGSAMYDDGNFWVWQDELWSLLGRLEFRDQISFVDLDYPAVGVGVDDLETVGTTLGALFGAGDAYEFGASVDAGVARLAQVVNSDTCPDTKYVLGGYSQGAMVVSKALPSLRADRVIYAATFGDPKIYLPEGKSYFALDSVGEWNKNLLHTGLIPAACRNENLSDYRMYVPDCYAYKGLLGAYVPYEPEGWAGKVGTWCNKRDVFCSSYVSLSDHLKYMADDLYKDAAKVIYSKVAAEFGLARDYTSEHDTVILIDSTGSMQSMIKQYKAEAVRLARETFNAGGRVALYEYRDLQDPLSLKKHCDFDTCTLATFQEGLSKITCNGGGDVPESLLSASFKAMSEQKWRYGATKSLVVLTDASFHEPDLDGTSFADVVALSKSIDPVNFYIVTNQIDEPLEKLAAATDGMLAQIGEASIVTDRIIERFDSLPRVEESEVLAEIPLLAVDAVVVDGGAARVAFKTLGAESVMVILNDAVVGVVDASVGFVEVTGLDGLMPNTLRLVPMSAERRGEGVEVALAVEAPVVPKAPNTGRK